MAKGVLYYQRSYVSLGWERFVNHFSFGVFCCENPNFPKGLERVYHPFERELILMWEFKGEKKPFFMRESRDDPIW